MDVDKAIATADEIVFIQTGQHLTDLERAVLQGCLQELSYQEIAEDVCQSYKYVKDVGALLFRRMSATVNEKVKKGNFQSALERYRIAQDRKRDRSLNTLSKKNSDKASCLRDAYRKQYSQNYGYVKILPGLMQRPLPLSSIYVAVKILDRNSISFLSATTIEETYRQFNKKNPFGNELIRQDGIVVAEKNPYLMVLGGPGVGKSTFLRKLGLEAFNQSEQRIPIFVELKQLVYTKEISLIDFIERELYQQIIPSNRSLLLSHLQEGDCLLLLDGLDEIPEDRIGEAIAHIQAFIKKFDKNRFVISCRTAAHSFNFNRFVDVIIAEFDDAQTQQFVDYWFNSTSQNKGFATDRFWTMLNTPKNSSLKELARSPLLLTYLCLVCNEDRALPSTRKDLYAKALDIILTDWSKQKGINTNISLARYGFETSIEIALLSEIAHENFQAKRLFFSKSYLLEKITQFLRYNPGIDSALTPDFLLDAITVRQGILVERFVGSFCFSHLTFQEYLTAYYAVKREQIEQLLDEHLTDSRWREVFLLASELMEDTAMTLIQSIHQRATTQISAYQKLQDLLTWCNLFITQEIGVRSTLSRRASLLAAVTAIASSRSSDVDLTVPDGNSIGSDLTKACESIIALSTENTTVYKTAVSCAVAIACSRALAYDLLESNADLPDAGTAFIDAEARAASIDSVVHNAGEMINSASDDRGLISQYIRSQVVRRSIVFACEIITPEAEQHSFHLNVFCPLSQKLNTSLETIPPALLSSEWYLWARDLEHSWLEVLGIHRSAISLSVEEAQVWQAYLYSSELLVRCKAAAIQIPHGQLAFLEEQLLINTPDIIRRQGHRTHKGSDSCDAI